MVNCDDIGALILTYLSTHLEIILHYPPQAHTHCNCDQLCSYSSSCNHWPVVLHIYVPTMLLQVTHTHSLMNTMQEPRARTSCILNSDYNS